VITRTPTAGSLGFWRQRHQLSHPDLDRIIRNFDLDGSRNEALFFDPKRAGALLDIHQKEPVLHRGRFAHVLIIEIDAQARLARHLDITGGRNRCDSDQQEKKHPTLTLHASSWTAHTATVYMDR
jgi:formamidopyrimidine-DNA glycosylase